MGHRSPRLPRRINALDSDCSINSVDFDEYGVDDSSYADDPNTDYRATLSSLKDMEEDMTYNDEGQLYAYAVYSLNLEGDTSDEHYKFINAVHNIATNFWNNQSPFDKSRPCIICSKSGHSFDDCDDLRDHNQVCSALIRLKSAVHCFVSTYNKLSQPKPISQLAAMNMRSLKNYAEVHSTTTSAPSQPEDSKILSAVHALTNNQIRAEKNLARTKRAVRQLASFFSIIWHLMMRLMTTMTIPLILILLSMLSLLFSVASENVWIFISTRTKFNTIGVL